MVTSSEDAELLRRRSGGRSRIWIVVAVIAVAVVLIVVGVLAGWFSPQPTTILGAGATFPYPLIAKWANVYNSSGSNVRVNYQGIGSGPSRSMDEVVLLCHHPVETIHILIPLGYIASEGVVLSP